MKVRQGVDISTPSVSDEDGSFVQEYIRSLLREGQPKGTPSPKKRAKFEQFIRDAQDYQELNQGYLEGETDEHEGFLIYKAPAIFHAPNDGMKGSEFWGKAFSEHEEFSIGFAGGSLEIFFHELFIE